MKAIASERFDLFEELPTEEPPPLPPPSEKLLTAWDKVGIPLQLRASQLNNLKTTSPNFIKIEIGFSRTVSTRIPKYHKICAHEWRSAPD